MTKPHTTLSEAVRAMNRAKLLPVWDDINHKLHAELDIIFKALDAAALVEQHEAQEPVYQMRHRSSQSVWTDFSEQAYKAWLDGGGSPDRVRVVYAQPTLAATQAGDAKDAARYRWFKDNYLKYGNSDPDIRRPIILFEGRWYGGHFDNMNDLDVAIDAAMSPTTTRSE